MGKNPRAQPGRRGDTSHIRPEENMTMRTMLTATAAVVAALAAMPAHAQDPNLARNLAATCANCHGTAGNALGEMKPLAGVSAGKILALLADYKSGNQPATIMHQIVKGYTDDQLKLVAGWFAAQTPKK
jgi:cytochrome subunit of sulfide dehydrogenase